MTEQQGSGASAKRAIPADSFAHRLMLARAHAGHISIREAAELTGFGRGAWTNWEKGTMPVDLDYVVEVISEKLDVDPGWLLLGGALAEDQVRSRRWSTLRPTRSAHSATERSQTTGPKLRMTDQRPGGSTRPMTQGSSARPRDGRPKGRPGVAVPNPRLRRPARVPSLGTAEASAA